MYAVLHFHTTPFHHFTLQASLAVFAGLCLVSGVLMAVIGARTKGKELRG
jgi:hypothetical protein